MSSKTDVVVKLSLVFFIALLSFSIGTFVGKKYTENQHELAALEPGNTGEKANREVASTNDENTPANPGEKNAAMSDADIAKLAAEFVSDDETQSTTNGAATEGKDGKTTANENNEAKNDGPKGHGKTGTTPVVKNETQNGNQNNNQGGAEPSAAAKEIAHGKIPAVTAEKTTTATTTKAEGRVPSSLPKDVAQYSVGKFTVQVAAYANEDEAQKSSTELKAKGYSAFYVPANVKGKTWYRVSVGQFATMKEAQFYRAELMSKAKVSSAMVQRITE